jgi:hypothetical protein
MRRESNQYTWRAVSKVDIFQLLKKSKAFYDIWKLIPLFLRAHQLPYPKIDESNPRHPILFILDLF